MMIEANFTYLLGGKIFAFPKRKVQTSQTRQVKRSSNTAAHIRSRPLQLAYRNQLRASACELVGAKLVAARSGRALLKKCANGHASTDQASAQVHLATYASFRPPEGTGRDCIVE